MSALKKVLIRTIVIEFYKENAGFLLVVLGLGFGFLKTPQHIDIASALAYQPVYYLAPLGLWILYSLKTLSFFFRIKQLPQNWFLTDLNTLKSVKQKWLAVYVQLLLLVPVLGYSIFMTIIAAQLGQIQSVLILTISNVAILITVAHFLHRRLITPVDISISKKSRDWTKLLPRTYSFLFIHHLAKRHGISLVLTKFFSIGIILGTTAIFNVEGVDLRYLALGLLLSSAVNASFSFKYNAFEKDALKLYRNLPLSKLNLFGKNSITFLILSLPEFLVFFGNNLSDVNVFELIKTVLIIPIMAQLYYEIIRWKGINEEASVKYIFFITAFLFFVILGYVELVAIEAVVLSMSVILMYIGTNRQE